MSVELREVERVFHQALAQGTLADRHTFLEQACGGNVELRQRVEALLAAHDEAASFLPLPAMDSAPNEAPIAEGPGTRIGKYKLLEQIGEGGFGIVFMAEQEEPVRRRVALKIIKLGMDTRQIVARFEAERQALALMDHPHIAKVLDGGATESGRPYFVMELVKGASITEYCDQNRLPIAQRLVLFIQVCQALQHAHVKGLIHRDIKPSNVLVTLQDGRPEVKVIDFGIAKATDARLTEKTLFTEFQQLIGTPQYMSPEQAGGSLDIDTRSDVYSLGVLLYELLTGATPFDPKELRSKAYDEMRRILREVDPPTPSTRLHGLKDSLPSVAASRAIEPRKLDVMLRGELDWITMKALEKERARRYESASALAADVMHYLADEPVVAAAPSRRYRLAKFIRKYRGPVIATAAILTTLVAGMAGTTVGLIGQSRQRAIAVEQAAVAQAVSKFLSDMFARADPGKLMGDKVTVVQAMAAAVNELDQGTLRDQPRVEAEVRETIGNTLVALGRFQDAESNFRRALELRRAAGEADHRAMTNALNGQAIVQRQLGNHSRAEALWRQALDIARRDPEGDELRVAGILSNLGLTLLDQNRLEEAAAIFRDSLDIHHRLVPQETLESARVQSNLASALLMQGKINDAEPLIRRALEARRRELPPGHPDVADALNNLSEVLRSQGKLGEAEAQVREAVEIARQSLPEGHATIGVWLNNLGSILQARGKLEEAVTQSQEALTVLRQALPKQHPQIAVALNNLGEQLAAQGKGAEAEPLLREAVAMFRATLPPGHPDIAKGINNLAIVLQGEKRLAEAEVLFRESLELIRKRLPPGHPQLAGQLANLGALMQDLGKLDEAEPLLREALKTLRQVLPPGHPHLALLATNLGSVLRENKKPAEAEPLFREAIQILDAVHGQNAWQATNPRIGLGKTLMALDRWNEAESELLQAEASLRMATEVPPGRYERSVEALATLYAAMDLAHPSEGYDQKAKKWRDMLPRPK